MSQLRPFFSILVPSYNRPEYLQRCLRSVLANRGVDLEVTALARSREFFEDLVIKAVVLDAPAEAELHETLPQAAGSLCAEHGASKWTLRAHRRWQLASYRRLFGWGTLFHLAGMSLRQAAGRQVTTRRVPLG